MAALEEPVAEAPTRAPARAKRPRAARAVTRDFAWRRVEGTGTNCGGFMMRGVVKVE
jgi:hypothetical protein